MKTALALVALAAATTTAVAAAQQEAAANNNNDVDKEAEIDLQFARFERDFGKAYASAPERAAARRNFAATLKRAAAQNARSAQLNSSARFGVTALADLSPAQFRERLLMPKYEPRRFEGAAVAPVPPQAQAQAPKSAMDWVQLGAVTPVKNQEQCGSCWAFSATEEVESANILMGNGKWTNQTIRLAPQQIVDCDQTSYGCGGGETESAYNYLIQAGGQEPSKDYPYTAQNGPCQAQKSEFVAGLASWAYATQSNDEHQMVQHMQSQPISICVDASQWQDYTGGVLMGDQCGSQLDHCVQATGYNMGATTSTPYWMVRNSWGTGWGLQGYIKLQMFQDTCGMATDATIVTKIN